MGSASHASPYSGSWYPGDAGELRELLTANQAESLQRTGAYLLPSPVGFVVPHAGIRYSGTVASAAYRSMAAAAPKRIILFGFPHRGTPSGLCVPDVASYRTPLGEIPVDQETVAELMASGIVRRVREALVCDHSTEMQLPFLQHLLPGVSLVPLSVSNAGREEMHKAAAVLSGFAGRRTLFVASSDFTHYGSAFRYRPFPPNAAVRDRLRDLDDDLADGAGSLDQDLFRATVRDHQSTLCGVDPISLLIATLQQLADTSTPIYQQSLDYQTSGEQTGDYEQSVSYRALGYYPYTSFDISPSAGAGLLSAAFRALRQGVEGGRRDRLTVNSLTLEHQARLPVFVTLYADGELRGCIGSCFNPRPLGESIPDLTLAALHDDRFRPLGSGDLSSAEIDISLLTPFRRIAHQDQWQPGVHGAMLRCGQRRGVLLPQVAAERHWEHTDFFQALARKAGCATDVYSRAESRLFVFQTHSIRGRYTDGG